MNQLEFDLITKHATLDQLARMLSAFKSYEDFEKIWRGYEKTFGASSENFWIHTKWGWNLKTDRELAFRVREFLADHGKRCADDETEWASPDASAMEAAAFALEQRLPVTVPFSEWGSGGYKPYNDKAARKLHDDLIEEIRIAADVKRYQ